MARCSWVLWGLWLAACSGGDDGEGVVTGVGACDESEDQGDCVVYTGTGWTASDVANNCTSPPVNSCPTTAQIGECIIDEGDEFETVSYFYEPQWRPPEARNACLSSNGTWTEL